MTQYKFHPKKKLLGGDSDENGIYISNDSIKFENLDHHAGTTLIDISDITSIQHVADFKFNFFLVAYSFSVVNAIEFETKNGNKYYLNLPEMKNVYIIEVLTSLTSKNSKINLTEEIKEVIETKKLAVTNRKYFWAVVKGMRWFILLLIVVFSLIFIPIILSL